MRIIWAEHVRERQKERFLSHAVSLSDVEIVVRTPEQTVAGEFGVVVAQSRLLGGLLRVPFVNIEGSRRIVTLHWTSKLSRYWRE